MSVSVLPTLVAWATSPNEPPLAVLYGAPGSGKTITAQGVVHHLLDTPPSQAPRWVPRYFPLRNCGFAEGVPTLEEILTESVRRNWVTEASPLPTGTALLASALTEPTLFVLDDIEYLMRKLASWTECQELMEEFLKLVPQTDSSGKWRGPYAGPSAKVLLALRSGSTALEDWKRKHPLQCMELKLISPAAT
jgi:hypothetical protein